MKWITVRAGKNIVTVFFIKYDNVYMFILRLILFIMLTIIFVCLCAYVWVCECACHSHMSTISGVGSHLSPCFKHDLIFIVHLYKR